MRQQRRPKKHVLVEFQLQKLYQRSPIKIDTQPLRLLDLNLAKIKENTLSVEEVLEETQLLSKLWWELLFLMFGEQMTVF